MCSSSNNHGSQINPWHRGEDTLDYLQSKTYERTQEYNRFFQSKATRSLFLSKKVHKELYHHARIQKILSERLQL